MVLGEAIVFVYFAQKHQLLKKTKEKCKKFVINDSRNQKSLNKIMRPILPSSYLNLCIVIKDNWYFNTEVKLHSTNYNNLADNNKLEL